MPFQKALHHLERRNQQLRIGIQVLMVHETLVNEVKVNLEPFLGLLTLILLIKIDKIKFKLIITRLTNQNINTILKNISIQTL